MALVRQFIFESIFVNLLFARKIDLFSSFYKSILRLILLLQQN